MITKVVKMYSKRMRIDLSKKDGFNADEEIILMSKAEYEDLKNQLFRLDSQLVTAESENKILKDRNNAFAEAIQESDKKIDKELEKLLEVSLKPINETHKEQLEDKDNKIEQLTDKVNAMQSAFNHFNTKINSLSALDILFRKKHNEVISDFIDSITITAKDKQIVNTDVKQISEKKD